MQGCLQQHTLVLLGQLWSTRASSSNLALTALGHVDLSELSPHLGSEAYNMSIMRSGFPAAGTYIPGLHVLCNFQRVCLGWEGQGI